MATYIMSIKHRNAGAASLNSVIWKTEAETLSEAKSYFVRLKDIDAQSFDEMFIVTKVNK